MKVFLVSNLYPTIKQPSYGIFIKNFESKLTSLGVTFICRALIKGKGRNNFSKTRKYFSFYLKIMYFGLFCHYDLIYVHFVSHSSFPIFLLTLLKKNKLVINYHGSDLINKKKSLTNIVSVITKNVTKKADLVIFPSKYYLSKAEEKYKLIINKNYLYPSGGINTKIFHPTNRSSKHLIFTLGFVSRIDEGKGWEIFLLIIKKLIELNYTVKGIIVGGGKDFEKMKSMIIEYKISDDVNVLGIVNQNRLNDIYNQLDLFIFPTYREAESLGLVGLEAMACSIPVIGSNIGGLKEYIVHQENGFLCTPKNVDDFLEKIIIYKNLKNTTKLKIKENALKTARKYDSEVQSMELVKKLNLLLDD